MAASFAQILGNKRIALMLPLGFASGLPLALTSGTLQAWLTVAGVDLKTIGIFTLVGLPYSLKFLWAPVMDRITLPWLGRRRGWMLVTQIAVAVGLALMGVIGTESGSRWLGGIAIAVAFMSASLDIVFDAYRTDVLLSAERGFGAAVWVNGYRLALLLASAGAFVLADHIGWRGTYLVLATLMAAGSVTVLLSPNPPAGGLPPKTLKEAVGLPLRELFARPDIYGLLSLIVLYKVGDAVAGSLQTAFFIGGLGFTAGEVGYVKGLGIAATLIGALAGGMVMAKTGLGPFAAALRHSPGTVQSFLHAAGLDRKKLRGSCGFSRHRKHHGWYGHRSLCRACDVPLRPSLHCDPICVAVFSGSASAGSLPDVLRLKPWAFWDGAGSFFSRSFGAAWLLARVALPAAAAPGRTRRAFAGVSSHETGLRRR